MNVLQGAERAVNFPDDLPRFAGLPMKVEFCHDEHGNRKIRTEILQYKSKDSMTQCTTWQLANLRSNKRKGKGGRLTHKQLQQEFNIDYHRLVKVNLYLDM